MRTSHQEAFAARAIERASEPSEGAREITTVVMSELRPAAEPELLDAHARHHGPTAEQRARQRRVGADAAHALEGLDEALGVAHVLHGPDDLAVLDEEGAVARHAGQREL